MTKTLVLVALVVGAPLAAAQPAPPPAPAPGPAPGRPPAPSPSPAPTPSPPAPSPSPAPTQAPTTGPTAPKDGQPAPSPAPKDAQPAPSPAPPGGKTEEQKRAEAKSLYETGLNHYNLGEFDEAIKAFRAAYAISSAPGLLFNIAQSFRLQKNYEQASYFYTTYLRLKPDAPNRADVEMRIKEMNDLVEEQKKLNHKPPTGTVTPDGNSGSGATPTKEPSVTVNLVDGRGARGVDTGGPHPGQSLMTAGLATGGAGAALLLTGIVFGRMASNAEKQLLQLDANMGTWTQAEQDKYDAGKRNNAIAIISFIAGGAAVATGGALWFVGNIKKREPTVAVAPGASGTTVAVGWRF